ncbi:MAG: HNH endonuclease [Planctomycetia bacterium]|nr:HNH endonuclease [Planctomycetia bacterium]
MLAASLVVKRRSARWVFIDNVIAADAMVKQPNRNSVRLADLISQETAARPEQIMLLRHGSAWAKTAFAMGCTLEDMTLEQPNESQYDYRRFGIKFVVAIVDDRVQKVYRIDGVEAEGTNYNLASPAFRRFLQKREYETVNSRRYKAAPFHCSVVGARVAGWTNPRLAPLRSTGELFWKIEVDVPDRTATYAEDRDYSKAQLNQAARNNSLRFGNVRTSDRTAVARQRVGQSVVRKLTLEQYGGRCAIAGCDVSDEGLLRASHIKGWAECEESRGDPSNVICLCGFHDALFENGFWSLDDELRVVVRRDIESKTILKLLPDGCSFRRPIHYPPGLDFVRYHRVKHGLRSS